MEIIRGNFSQHIVLPQNSAYFDITFLFSYVVGLSFMTNDTGNALFITVRIKERMAMSYCCHVFVPAARQVSLPYAKKN